MNVSLGFKQRTNAAIALAVGKVRMRQDALDLVQILGNIQGRLCGPFYPFCSPLTSYKQTLPKQTIRNRNTFCIVGGECVEYSVKTLFHT